MQSGGNILNAASAANAQQMQQMQQMQNSQPGQNWNQAAPQGKPDPMQNGSGSPDLRLWYGEYRQFLYKLWKTASRCGMDLQLRDGTSTGNFCSNCGKPRQ